MTEAPEPRDLNLSKVGKRTAYKCGFRDGVASVAPAPVRVKDLDGFDMLIAEARTEAAKAMRKFPQPNYVISKVAEEAGEVVKAAIHAAEGRETMENLRDEMMQVIAMLYRLWIEGDQVHGLPPVAAALDPAKEPTDERA